MDSWELSLCSFSLAEFEDMNLIQPDDLLSWDMQMNAADPGNASFPIMSQPVKEEGDREGGSVTFSLAEGTTGASPEQQSLREDPPNAAIIHEIKLEVTDDSSIPLDATVASLSENRLTISRGVQVPSKALEGDSVEPSSSSGNGEMSPKTEALISETVLMTADTPKRKLGRPPKIPTALAVAAASAYTPTKGKKARAARTFVPEEKKDEEYRRQRARNNEAVRKCRAKKKQKFLQSVLDNFVQSSTDLEQRRLELRVQVEKLRCDVILQGIKLAGL